MGIKAVYFDGSTYLQNDAIPSMPSSSPYGLLSFWYNASSSTGVVLQTSDAYDDNSVWVILRQQLQIDLADGPDYTNFMERIGSGANADMPYDGNWHHVLMTWDTQSGSCVCYLDNAAYAMSDLRMVSRGSFDIPYGSSTYVWQIGADPEYRFVTGSIAELFFLAGVSVDITSAAVREKFIDPNTLLPPAIDAGGFFPLGNSDYMPQIFLSGDATGFLKNYPNWSATCVGQTDSSPSNSFYVATGTLQTASDDPFAGAMS
jgi:hypothetical protein